MKSVFLMFKIEFCDLWNHLYFNDEQLVKEWNVFHRQQQQNRSENSKVSSVFSMLINRMNEALSCQESFWIDAHTHTHPDEYESLLIGSIHHRIDRILKGYQNLPSNNVTCCKIMNIFYKVNFLKFE